MGKQPIDLNMVYIDGKTAYKTQHGTGKQPIELKMVYIDFGIRRYISKLSFYKCFFIY